MKEVKEFIENLPDGYDKERILSVYEKTRPKDEKITLENSYKLYGKFNDTIQKCYVLIYEALCKLGDEEVTFNNPIIIHQFCVENSYLINIKKIKFERLPIIWTDNIDFHLRIIYDVFDLKDEKKIVKENWSSTIDELPNEYGILSEILEKLNYLISKKSLNESYPKTMTVVNKDIIITDPCYIRKRQEEKEHEYINFNLNGDLFDLVRLNGWKSEKITMQQLFDAYKKEELYYTLWRLQSDVNNISDSVEDWSESEYVKNYLTSNTIYGDWSCTTFDTDTNESIGEFCADGGEVGVFVLDEVLKYNPDFDYHINRTWTTTLIKNFTGEVSIVKRHNEGVYEDETEWHKKGEKWEEDSIHVIGKGNINFETTQTGF